MLIVLTIHKDGIKILHKKHFAFQMMELTAIKSMEKNVIFKHYMVAQHLIKLNFNQFLIALQKTIKLV